ncbi:hypothetical protein GQ42DRAFT_66307 [Ramicandelaber brevisporus]|nr:hypothetical protein GQ42DRAFT_66307 [Ramicandelaber brevisporus]
MTMSTSIKFHRLLSSFLLVVLFTLLVPLSYRTVVVRAAVSPLHKLHETPPDPYPVAANNAGLDQARWPIVYSIDIAGILQPMGSCCSPNTGGTDVTQLEQTFKIICSPSSLLQVTLCYVPNDRDVTVWEPEITKRCTDVYHGQWSARAAQCPK